MGDFAHFPLSLSQHILFSRGDCQSLLWNANLASNQLVNILVHCTVYQPYSTCVHSLLAVLVSCAGMSRALVVSALLLLLRQVSGRCESCSRGLQLHDHPRTWGRAEDGKALKGYTFTSRRVFTMLSCLETCSSECKCASMNYQKADSGGLHLCELSYETSDSKPDALSNQSDYLYLDIHFHEQVSSDQWIKPYDSLGTLPKRNWPRTTNVCDNWDCMLNIWSQLSDFPRRWLRRSRKEKQLCRAW